MLVWNASGISKKLAKKFGFDYISSAFYDFSECIRNFGNLMYLYIIDPNQKIFQAKLSLALRRKLC